MQTFQFFKTQNMKKTITITISLVALIAHTACDKKYSDNPYSPENNRVNHTFYNGDKSHYYIDYNTDIIIDLTITDSLSNSIVIDSIDFDNDSRYDFRIHKNIDYYNNTLTIYFESIYPYFYTISTYTEDVFNYGNILYDILEWYRGNFYMMIECSYTLDEEDNIIVYSSNTKIPWDEEKYYPFRNTCDDKTSLGWLRIEFNSSDLTLIVKDCGYKRIEEFKGYFYCGRNY